MSETGSRLWLVGGPSSVGKTTACIQLADQLGARLLSIDTEFGEHIHPPDLPFRPARVRVASQ